METIGLREPNQNPSDLLRRMIVLGDATPPAERGMPDMAPELAPELPSLSGLLLSERVEERLEERR